VEAELCRAVAHEAARRGARVNVHELWAALEAVNDVRPRLIVDIDSGPAVLWAWWSMATAVIGVSSRDVPPAAFSGERLPESVTALVGDPGDASTVLRVADQVAGRPVDVLVLGDPSGSVDGARRVFNAYIPMVREKGLALVHGIADRHAPGIRQFWRGVASAESRELIGSVEPVIGYGVVKVHGKVHGKDSADHG
jgi:hypothetical protein